MAQNENIYPITTLPGVKRDGTDFESNHYIDAQWCRFDRGLPKKMGGYRRISNDLSGPVYGSHLDRINGLNYIYAGSANSLEMSTIDQTGAGSGVTDRTPGSFPTSPNNVWQFDNLYDAGGSAKRIVAHAGQNLMDISSSIQSPIYFGKSDASAALTSTGTSVSGGVFSLFPYMIGLDNDGYVLWSPPNTMSFSGAGSGDARIAPNKLIKGVRTRGGSGASPSGLIWSLDELYRIYFSGGSTIFSFDWISDTSLLSTRAVVEHNGRHYWPDFTGCFKTFAGVVEDLPNDMNLDYFFDNLNKEYRQKVWGIKIPRFNEIWWFWPKGNSTYCTDVLIYNIKEKVWYDTAWAEDQLARSCGIYSKSFEFPIMFGLDANNADKYKMWQHEFGVDRTEDGVNSAIKSYFETSDLAYSAAIAPGSWTGVDRWVQIKRFEPDFNQVGTLKLYIKGRKYSNGASTTSPAYPFTSSTEKIDMKEQQRLLTLKIESNESGGDYELGKNTLLHLSLGDGRQ